MKTFKGKQTVVSLAKHRIHFLSGLKKVNSNNDQNHTFIDLCVTYESP